MTYWAVLAVMVVGILLRFVYLDADPYYYLWIGYIPDEGRWNESARNLIHGRSIFVQHGFNFHLLLAPIFQLTNYLVYLAFDISRLTSRLFPAIWGSSILLLFYFNLRSKVTPQALLFGITLLASQTDLVSLSRVSIPETTVMFFQLLIFFTILSRKYSPFNLVIAGLLMFITVGMKATTLPFLGIFSIIIFIMPTLQVNGKGDAKWRNLFFFWSGFAAPIIIAGITWLVCCVSNIAAMIYSINIVNSLVSLSNFHGLFNVPFVQPISTTINIWGLGLWVTLLSWIAMGGRRDEIGSDNKRILVAAIVWFALYFILMQSLGYYPQRYKVHILIPMAIIITLGIHVFQKTGFSNLNKSFENGKIISQLFKIAILVLPASAMFAPLLLFVFGPAISDPTQLRYKLIFTAISFLLFICAGYALKHNKKAIGFFLLFPLIVGFFWQLLTVLPADVYHFWLNMEEHRNAALWTLILFASSSASIVLASAASQWNSITWGRVINVAALFYLTISLIRISPAYISPHYTLKDTSIKLGKLLVDEPHVVSYNSAGLFIDNSIPYRWFIRVKWKTDMPDMIVKAQPFFFNGDQEFFDENYHPIKKYKLHLSQEYFDYWPRHQGEEVVVYKKNDSAQNQSPALTRSSH